MRAAWALPEVPAVQAAWALPEVPAAQAAWALLEVPAAQAAWALLEVPAVLAAWALPGAQVVWVVQVAWGDLVAHAAGEFLKVEPAVQAFLKSALEAQESVIVERAASVLRAAPEMVVSSRAELAVRECVMEALVVWAVLEVRAASVLRAAPEVVVSSRAELAVRECVMEALAVWAVPEALAVWAVLEAAVVLQAAPVAEECVKAV